MRTLLTLVGGALVLIVNGCSNGHAGMNMGSSQGAPVVATGSAVTPLAGAAAVHVTLSEYVVSMDTASVPTGAVHLLVTNNGQRPHELRVYPKKGIGSGGHNMTGGKIPGTVGILQLVPVGQTVALDVTLPSGAWEVACHLLDSGDGKSFDHYDRGMKATLTVQ